MVPTTSRKARHDRLRFHPARAPARPAAGDAEGRAAHPHRGLARARADLRAGGPQRRDAAYPSVDALRAAYAFTDLQSFLDIYYAGRQRAAARAATSTTWRTRISSGPRADHVVHAEIFFDPQTHTARGVDDRHGDPRPRVGVRARRARARRLEQPDPVLPAPPRRGRRAGDARGGAAVSRALHRRRPRQQRARPPAGKVRARSSRARGAEGLHLVAHAGEEGPPAYIRSALDVLKVERIDHGVRCVEDPALVERLAREADAR